MQRRALLGFAGFLGSFIAYGFLYDSFVVPELPNVKRVPMIWWLGCAAPVIFAALAAGWFCQSFREVLVLSAMGCFAYLVLLPIIAVRSHALPPGPQAISLALLVAPLLCLLVVGWLLGRFAGRRAA